MRLSIIIPVYNVGQYLERCVESCEKQNILKEDYELIIVDDGSLDNSLQIANDLAKKYDNIIVISQVNQGLSGARNTGVAHATGKYLWFVDSDDCVVENSIAHVLSLSEKNDLDICHFSSMSCKIDGTAGNRTHFSPLNVLMEGKNVLLQNSNNVIRSVWSNFYKRSFFINNGLNFVIGLTQEDVELNGRAYAVAHRCMFVDNLMYIYYYNPNSLSNNQDLRKRIKYIGDTVRVAALHYDYFTNKCSDAELRKFFIKHINSRIAGGLRAMIKKNEDKRVIEEFVSIAKEKKLYPIGGSTLSWKWNLLTPIINHQSLWWLLKII